MTRFLKWVYNSWFGDWWNVSCYHCDKHGDLCTRVDCHPGACHTTSGGKFYSGDYS